MTIAEGKFSIALIQMAARPDAAENLALAVSRIEEAARQGAQIVCLQELFRTPYFCQREEASNFDLAESVPGPTTEEFGKLARSLGVVIIAPVFERRAAGVYHNSAAVLDADGEFLGHYRKMHIPDDPLYYEKFYFTPGDLGFRVFDTKVARVGVLICWDQWYPEAARLTTLKGAQILLYPSAIGWHPSEKETEGASQLDAWLSVQRGHAIANGVYVAAVNRVGHERVGEDDGIVFFGHSFVADPFGRVIAEAGEAEEQVLLAECDPAQQERARREWPFLRDRRVDAYGPITRRLIDP